MLWFVSYLGLIRVLNSVFSVSSFILVLRLSYLKGKSKASRGGNTAISCSFKQLASLGSNKDFLSPPSRNPRLQGPSHIATGVLEIQGRFQVCHSQHRGLRTPSSTSTPANVEAKAQFYTSIFDGKKLGELSRIRDHQT